ncbi:hypothetical protein M4D52_05370 [Paenibacillus lactis]|uniref:hypothetical protein n=1 Tax=Paenibacillus lactis TaxID=228574 RepID=UPI002040B86F|nr:hypothetical protein [Paenibacillus lactis]MCM3492870.1 hypothetical protein [Paenibacillus lactis]
MNEAIKCGYCDKELTDKTEIEYSQYNSEFYCNPDCAKSAYFEAMGSSPLDLTDKQLLKEHNIKLSKGKLVCAGGANE